MTQKPLPVTEAEWREKLSAEQYRIMREKGTERPFTGQYAESHETGMFACAACGAQLFSSDAKFDSGTGWPSFDQALPGAVKMVPDDAHGMHRTEVVCANCGSHLGHIFDDGPRETTGKRFCINSACLMLKKSDDGAK